MNEVHFPTCLLMHNRVVHQAIKARIDFGFINESFAWAAVA